MPRTGAVVVAAGRSSRMGGADKIFALLGGKPVLCYAIEALQRSDAIAEIVLVTAAERVAEASALMGNLGSLKPLAVVAGGSRRRDSVLIGLERLAAPDLVLVHDGARPFLSSSLIETGIEAAADTGAAIAAVPVADTLKRVSAARDVLGTVDRTGLWAVQTPQVFDYRLLLAAHRQHDDDVSDDAMLIEALGRVVKVFPGSARNLKITTPDDLLLAEALLACG